MTGAAGMLGSDLVPVLEERGYSVLATDINILEGIKHLDVRDYRSVNKTISDFKPSFVIHLAAETNVDKCETDPDHAYETNALGTENIVLTCLARNTTLIYVSTVGVFDGTKTGVNSLPEPYTEFDSPNPINVCGTSKYEGERIVAKFLDNHFTIRAGWMIGGMSRDKKFVSKIMGQIRGGAKKIYAVDDKWGTPTYTLDFSKALVSLMQTPYYGLYHAACKARALLHCPSFKRSLNATCQGQRLWGVLL